MASTLRLGVAASLLALVLVRNLGGCLTHSCTLMGCAGRAVTVALVDEQGQAAAARGEVDFESHARAAFDCTVAPDLNRGDIACEQGVLQLGPMLNPGDTLALRFQNADGSFGEWQAVSLSVTRRVLPDFNGPDCDCEVSDATATPVVVPEGARLPWP